MLFGQEEIATKSKKKFGYKLEFNYKGAFILPHSGAVKAIMNGTTPVFEFGAEFPNVGNKDFHSSFPLNKWGVMFNYAPLTNKEILGFGLGLMPYLNINLRRHKESNWKARLGSGIGFIQKPFNNITNPKNMVVGSYLNNITDFSLCYKLHLSRSLSSKIGFGLQHFSNGAYIRPNLGINLPYLSISIKQDQWVKRSCLKLDKDTTNEKSGFFISSVYGSKTLALAATKRYNVIQLSGGYSFGFKRGKYLHLQTDLIFDESTPYLKDYNFALSPFAKWIVGLFATYEKKFGQVGFLIGSGHYLHSPYRSFDQDWSYANKGGNFYNRVGIKYYLSQEINLQISIRTHSGEADNAEFGIGYKF